MGIELAGLSQEERELEREEMLERWIVGEERYSTEEICTMFCFPHSMKKTSL